MKFLNLIIIFIFTGLILGGCSKTVYHSTNKLAKTSSPFDRQVWFKLHKSYYNDFPECVGVFPTTGQKNVHLKKNLERALARHLFLKVPRILTSEERIKLERRYAISLKSESGLRQFVKNSQCKHAAQVNLIAVDDSFLGVWAQKKLIIEVRLFRIKDDIELWRSRHKVSRSDGDLPLSPLSLGVGVFKAASHKNDADIMISMIDDALRRMLITLPTIR